MRDKIMTYESTKVEGDYLYGVWDEGFQDVDTGNVIVIKRHEAIAYSDVVLKKKQSKLFSDKWAFYDYNPETMEFPVLVYYQWKKGKAPKIEKKLTK